MTNEEFQEAMQIVRYAFADGQVERQSHFHDAQWEPAAHMCVLDDTYRLKRRPREIWVIYDAAGHFVRITPTYPTSRVMTDCVVYFREVIE